VPTIGAAVVYDIYKSGASIPDGGWQALVIGFTTAFVVALPSIRFLIRAVSGGTLAPFGYYRIGAAIVMAVILLR
jgi:undecaprenyl-diphosphatase